MIIKVILLFRLWYLLLIMILFIRICWCMLLFRCISFLIIHTARIKDSYFFSIHIKVNISISHPSRPKYSSIKILKAQTELSIWYILYDEVMVRDPVNLAWNSHLHADIWEFFDLIIKARWFTLWENKRFSWWWVVRLTTDWETYILNYWYYRIINRALKICVCGSWIDKHSVLLAYMRLADIQIYISYIYSTDIQRIHILIFPKSHTNSFNTFV